MKNIDTAFRHIRTFSILVIIACIIVSSLSLYKSYTMVSKVQNKVYILAEGKIMEAYSSDRNENIEVEARDHVKTFHQSFFSLDPDEKVIRKNLTKALYLADGTAKQEYDNLQESGYYSGLIAGNISQTISVDSIFITISQYPYPFKLFATQEIIRTTSKVHRRLVTEGVLRKVARSDNNPHGFLIEKWAIVDNKDISTEGR